MNLFTRILLLFATVSLLVFLVGGVISYGVMKREIDLEQQRFLIERLDHWTGHIAKRTPVTEFTRNSTTVTPLGRVQEESLLFSDTLVMHSQLERLELHLKVTAIRNVNSQSYKISTYGLIVESDDIVDAVTESLVKIYLILLAVILPLGAVSSYFILKPFKATLEVIKTFSLKNSETEFPKSKVSEFKKLNSFLTSMTEKMSQDYKSLKEFSENASHEIQTPLGIIQTKIEVLMDSENLSEEQVTQLYQIQNTLKRLSNLSNSLSTLMKIENQEFSNLEEIDLSGTIENLLDEFDELRELKSITLNKELTPKVLIKADQNLVELLLTNVINNSIRHNLKGGNITIKLTSSELTITNSGKDFDFDPKLLFERFRKSNQSNTSIGLGLAIVKTICDLYDFNLNYEQADANHTLSIIFNRS